MKITLSTRPLALKVLAPKQEVQQLRCVDYNQLGMGYPGYGLMPLTPAALWSVKDLFPQARVDSKVCQWLGRENRERELLATAYSSSLWVRHNPEGMYDFQTQGVSFILDQFHGHRVLIGDDPRLGKTIQALCALERLPIDKPVFVFTMKSLLDNWASEVGKWSSLKPVVLTGSAEVRADYINNTAAVGEIVITNWETLRISRLKQRRLKIIIGDECHYVRNRKAQVTKAFLRLRPDIAMLMSATLTERGSQDYFPYLAVLRPREFTSYWRFVTWYCKTQYNGFGNDIIGAANEDILLDHLAPFSLRRRASETADVPEKQFTELAVRPNPELEAAYELLAEKVLVEIEGRQLIIPNALARTVRLRQLSTAPQTLGFSFESPKVEAIVDYIASLGDVQCVVYTSFRESARLLAQRLSSATLWVGGEGSPADFVAGKTKALVCTPQLGGVGLDLSNADVIIYADLPQSSTLLRQSIERTTKIGLKKPRLIVSVVCLPIDYAMAAALKEKQEDIADVDIYDYIMMYLRK